MRISQFFIKVNQKDKPFLFFCVRLHFRNKNAFCNFLRIDASFFFFSALNYCLHLSIVNIIIYFKEEEVSINKTIRVQ